MRRRPAWGGQTALEQRQAEGRPGVVIVAAGATPDDVRPYADSPYWELWGCNSVVSPFTADPHDLEAHRWFQLHPLEVCETAERVWADLCPVPIYVLDAAKRRVPMAVPYPWEALPRLPVSVGGFGSTFAYEVALAILEKKTRLVVLGVGYSEPGSGTVREQLVEGPNLWGWLAYAMGCGLHVDLERFAPGTPMGGYRYGIDYWPERTAVAAWCRTMRASLEHLKLDG